VVLKFKKALPSFWGSADMFVFEEMKLRGGRRCLVEKGFLCNQKKSPRQKGKKKKMLRVVKKGVEKITSECS